MLETQLFMAFCRWIFRGFQCLEARLDEKGQRWATIIVALEASLGSMDMEGMDMVTQR